MPTVIDDSIGWNLVNILSVAQEQVELTLGHVKASRCHFPGDGIDGVAQIKCDPLLGNRSAERVNKLWSEEGYFFFTKGRLWRRVFPKPVLIR